MTTKHALWLCSATLIGCGSSVLQPSISDRLPTTAVDGVAAASGTVGGAGGSSAGVGGAGGAGGVGSGAGVSGLCALAKGHGVYYAGSTITITFVCPDTVTQVAATGLPAFLTGAASGKNVTFTGTAPAAPSSTQWSFVINGQPTLSTSLTTAVIDSVPTAALKAGTPDLTSAYGTPVDLGLAAVTLDPTWDGSTDDVTLSLLPGTPSGSDTPSSLGGAAFAAADTDIPQLTYESSCAGATGVYVCPAATAAAGTDAVTGGGLLEYAYSPFDQGQYTVTFRPLLTIEGATIRLPALTQTLTVPEAVYGNVTLSHNGDTNNAAAFDSVAYSYGLAVGAGSTPLAPVLGYAYTSRSGGVNLTYLSRLTLDRTVAADTASPTGVSQLATGSELHPATHDTGLARMVSLTDGSWAMLSMEKDASSNQNAMFEHASSASTPTSSQYTTLMTVSNPNVFYSLDASAPYDDAGTTRMAFIALSSSSGINYVDIGKVNPANGTQDDAVWDAFTGSDFNTNTVANIDQGTIREATYTGLIQGTTYTNAPAFFIGYRQGNDLQLGIVLGRQDSGAYKSTLVGFLSDLNTGGFNVFNDVVPGTGAAASELQSFRLAVGTPSGGSQVVGVVWREQNANNGAVPGCWFRRIDSSLNTATRSTPLKLSSGECKLPSLQFDQTTGRFIATYGEKVAGTWQISEREITVGAATTDTASAAMTIASGLASYPTQLETAFYPAGRFMGLLYRVHGTDTPKIHGFHVSSH